MPVVGGPTYDDAVKNAKTHLIPFTDHRGNPARVVFRGLASQPLLPQLFMFAVYFTHVDATPESLDIGGLMEAVRFSKAYPPEFRLEAYFLPGASDDDCIAHYRREKAARGTYDAHIDAVDNPATATFTTINSPPTAGAIPEGGSLPGMVPTYSDPDSVIRSFDGLLFVCPERNWSDGDRVMCCVYFDHIGPERYNQKLGGRAELKGPPPIKASTWSPINEESPKYSYGDLSISENMHDTSRQDSEELGAYFEEARDNGWVCW
jgi:hypothetical protein